MSTLENVTQLLQSAGPAHHQAYIETDGEDPEWPLWYANYLQADLNAAMGTNLTQSEIVYWLLHLDKEYRAKSPSEPWPIYYANILLNELT